MPFLTLMRCGLCGGSFTGNHERVPSFDPESRTEAARIVDQRHGYTLAQAPDPQAHAQEYDDEERKLFDPARRLPLCETCVTTVNEARAASGLSTWEIYHDSYGVASGLPG